MPMHSAAKPSPIKNVKLNTDAERQGYFMTMKLCSIVLDSEDFNALAKFYVQLLGGELLESTEYYATVSIPNSHLKLYFQYAEGYTPPTWPEESGKQQQMLHLDFITDHVEKAVEHALLCGATIASAQYMEESRVMIDPAGHPFCICNEN